MKREKLSIRDPLNTGHPANPAYKTRRRRVDAAMESWLSMQGASSQALDRYRACRAAGFSAQKARDVALRHAKKEAKAAHDKGAKTDA